MWMVLLGPQKHSQYPHNQHFPRKCLWQPHIQLLLHWHLRGLNPHIQEYPDWGFQNQSLQDWNCRIQTPRDWNRHMQSFQSQFLDWNLHIRSLQGRFPRLGQLLPGWNFQNQPPHRSQIRLQNYHLLQNPHLGQHLHYPLGNFLLSLYTLHPNLSRHRGENQPQTNLNISRIRNEERHARQ